MSALGPESDTQQITTFVDDVNIENYEKPLMSTVKGWTKIAEDERLHDIHSVLKRPVIVNTGEFNTAFTNRMLKFPDVIFQKSKNVVNKLNYFTYFRANVKIRLVFNATPFMSGKYWMFFAPFDKISNRGARLTSLPNCTGYPGVEIDLASNAPVEIKIPYCAPLSHYNLIDTHSNMGELYINPINPVQTGTAPVALGAPYTIFAWFEDVEVAMPTSLPLTMPSQELPELHAQVGKSEEQAVTSGAPISGIAGAIASTASALGNIPILGPWVRPVEWVSRAVQGVASTFGWNKPTNLDKNCPYSNITAKGYTNVNGIDISSKLGAMPDNGLTYESGIFSTDVDEMDIKYIASKSCIYKAAIPWKITSAVDALLHTAPVAPGLCDEVENTHVMEPTTLAYLASMFRYWRGGLNFRIAVAKTAFHTGRLRITYHPGIYVHDTACVSENAYNWILDLSVSSELEFKIPYVSNVPWKESLVSPPDDAVWQKEKHATGIITIEVLTPLRRSSDVVANNCPINMWIAGAEDIAFAIPDMGNYFVYGDTTIEEEDEFEEEELKAQVFNLTQSGIEHNEQVESDAQNTFPKSNMSITTAEELSMGEKITNLRELCKRFAPTTIGYSFPYKTTQAQFTFPGPIALNNDTYLYNQIEIDPAYFGKANEGVLDEQKITYPVFIQQGGAIVDEEFLALRRFRTTNPLHRISYLYRFFRGGKRYKVLNPVTNGVRVQNSGWRPATTGEPRQVYENALDTVTFDSNRPAEPIFAVRNFKIEENGDVEAPKLGTFTSAEQDPVFEHMVYPDLNGVLEFEVPYYGQTPISLVGEGTLSSEDGPLVRRSKIVLRRNHDPRGMDRPIWNAFSYVGYMASGESDDPGGMRGCFGGFSLYEAAADDFSFGYLVGAPRIRRLINP
jgi:hypothetical protein